MLSGLLLWLLPTVFVLHDAEEAVFLPRWLRRNRERLALRFPRLDARLLSRAAAISEVRFALMATEELVLLLGVTLYASLSHAYYPWLALFLAFGVHLAVHLAQWIAVGSYVPAGATALAGSVYFGWGLHALIDARLFTLGEFLFCGAAGCAVAALNLLLLHAANRNSEFRIQNSEFTLPGKQVYSGEADAAGWSPTWI